MSLSQAHKDAARAEQARPPILEGRLKSGDTQEAFAEALGIDVRTLRRYESGELPTPDEIMRDVAIWLEDPILLYRHFKVKYEIGDEIMPQVEVMPLSLAVVNLLSELAALERHNVASRLLDLARDDVIDPGEASDYAMIMDKLDGVKRAVELLRYCRRGIDERSVE